MKIRSMGVACAALLALAACGSATDAVTFKAPATYQSAASIGPFMQVWTTADKHDALILMKLPTQVSLDQMLAQSSVKNATVHLQRQLTICGSQPAVYAEMTGVAGMVGNSSSGKEPGDVDFIGTNVSGHTYMAMYVRDHGTPVDPAAVAAIHDVCPK